MPQALTGIRNMWEKLSTRERKHHSVYFLRFLLLLFPNFVLVMESLNVDKKTALVIELLGASAIPILDENPQYRYNRQSPRTSWSRSEYAFTREATPVVSADETTGGFLSLPWSPGHERNGYVFGRGEAGFAHVKLPAYLAKALSTAHFKIFLNRYKIWVVESLSSNGTMYRGMLLQSQQRALHPEEPNEIRIGDLQLLVHIPNPPSSLEYERGYECVSIGPSTSRSSASIASTSIWSQAAPQTVSSDICEYHVCQKQPIQPPHPNVHHIPLSNDLVERNTSGIFPETWSTKFAAIGIRDCRPYVVKYYTENDHEQRQFSTIAYLSRVRYSQLLKNDSDFLGMPIHNQLYRLYSRSTCYYNRSRRWCFA